jgi:hypothetical protein
MHTTANPETRAQLKAIAGALEENYWHQQSASFPKVNPQKANDIRDQRNYTNRQTVYLAA